MKTLSTARALIVVYCLALGAASAQAEIILYSYDFTDTGSLDGKQVDTSGATAAEHALYGTVENESWSATTDAGKKIFADGTYEGDTSADRSTASLSFAPQDGYVYTLSMTTDFENPGGWHAAGYVVADNWTGDPLADGSGLNIWGLTRPGATSPQTTFFDADGGTDNSQQVASTDTGADNTAPSTLHFELDTTAGAGNWAAKWLVGDTVVREVSDLGTITIGSVGIGALYDATNSTSAFQSFELSVAPDTNAPIITSLDPSDNAPSAPVGGNLVVTFNENVTLTGAGTITITDLDDGSSSETIILPAPAKVTVSGNDLTIDPSGDLELATSYSVQISTNAIEDLAIPSNAFAGITNNTDWNFATEATATIAQYDFSDGKNATTEHAAVTAGAMVFGVEVAGSGFIIGTTTINDGAPIIESGTDPNPAYISGTTAPAVTFDTGGVANSLAASITASNYLSFKVTPDDGYKMDVTSLSVILGKDDAGVGPRVELLTSFEAWDATNTLGQWHHEAASTCATYSWDLSSLPTEITAETEFRLYFHDTASSGWNDMLADDVKLKGTVSQIPPAGTVIVIR